MVQPNVPSLDSPEVEAAWQAAAAEQAFWETHYGELLERYPDQFVAVSDGVVIATNPDLQQLIQDLEHRGIEPRRIWVRFVTADPHRIML